MAEIAQAFIRLHPDDTGFGPEVEEKVRKSTQGTKAKIPLAVDDQQATGALDRLKARLVELSKQTYRAGLDVDDKAAQARLAAFAVKLGDLNRKVVNPKISVDGVVKAEAQVLALQVQFDKLNRSQDGVRASSLRLQTALQRVTPAWTGMLAAGLALGPALLPVLAAVTVATLGIGAAAVAGGAALGLLAAAATTQLSAASTAAKAVTTAQSQYQATLKQVHGQYLLNMDAAKTSAQREAALATAQKATGTAHLAQLKAEQIAYAGMTPQQIALSKAVGALQGAWDKFTSSGAVTTVLERGISLLLVALPKLTPLLNLGANAAGLFVGILDRWVQGGGLDRLVRGLTTLAGGTAIPGLAAIVHNLATAFGALAPSITRFTGGAVDGLVKLTAAFARWAQNKGSGALTGLMRDVQRDGPAVLKLLSTLAQTVPALVRGLNPLAPVSLAIATALAKLIAVAPPGVITGLAIAFVSLYTGVKLASLAITLINAAEALSVIRTKAVVVWNGIAAGAAKAWAAAQWLLNAALDANPIGLVVLAIAALAAGFYLIYTRSTTFRKVVGEAFQWVLKTGRDLGNWLWGDFAVKIIHFFTQTIPHAFGVFTSSVTRDVINPVKHGLGDLRQWIYDDFIVKIGQFFTKTLPASFHTAVHLLGVAWTAIQNTIKVPVNWVIQHVINDGLIGAFDWISSKVGGPTIKKLPTLARGGSWGRVTAGTHSTADDVLARISKGETVVSADHSRVLAPIFSAVGVPGYAGGGIPAGPGSSAFAMAGGAGQTRGGNPASALFNDIKSAFGKIEDAGKIIAAISTGNTTALNHAIMALIGNPHGGATDLAKLLVDVPATLVKDVVRFFIAHFGADTTVGGGSGSAVAQYAKGYGTGRSHPYVLGGSSPTGWDCSGFAAWVYEHFGYFPGRQGTRYGTSESQFASNLLQPSGPQAGALVFFNDGVFADPGHVGVALNNRSYVGADSPSVGTIISSLGGNVGFRVPRGGFRTAAASAAAGALGGNVVTWLREALGNAGAPASWLRGMEILTQAESGGNARAVNPILVLGQHAEGLDQMLPSTYRAWATIPGGIFNPVSNATAAVRYIRAEYGSPYNIPGLGTSSYRGYRYGGRITEPIAGLGLRSGRQYGFGEQGVETVTPGAGGGGAPLIGTAIIREDADANLISDRLGFLLRHTGGFG